MTITAEQMRAARALIDLNQDQLAAASGLSIETIKRAERDIGKAKPETAAQIVAALESAGVEFMPATSLTGPGVRLRLGPADPFRAFAQRIAAAQPGDDFAAFIEEARKLLT